MKWKGIKKVHEGKFVVRYDVLYETEDKREKVYEIISRDRDITTQQQMHGGDAEAVVLIMHNKEYDKILLNKEFRLAVGEWVYNFPAGLLEKGETPMQGGARELKEETGLDLVKIDEILGNSYSAVGFSNEKNKCIIGVAEGEFSKSTSTEEEIEAGWYTKEQVRKLLEDVPFAARTQAYCYLWSKNS